MSLQDRRRDRLKRECAPYLGPGEVFEAGFACCTGQLANKVVVATSSRLLLLNATQWVVIKVTGLEAELSRDVRFGPPKGALFPVPATGPNEVVGRAWFFGVREVDAALEAHGRVE